MKVKHTPALMQFLDASPCSFLAVKTAEKVLQSQGFIPLDETNEWKLLPGKGYYTIRNQSSLIAFRLGSKPIYSKGFCLTAAHLDSPALKLKVSAEKVDKNYLKVPVEVYGGPITNTWLDRELSIAGRVMVRTETAPYPDRKNKGKKPNPSYEYQAQLVHFTRPLAIIPNAAIHLNRDINKGFEYNAQIHLPAILRASSKDAVSFTLKDIIAAELGVSVDCIGEADLFLFDTARATQIGVEGELLASGRLDDLAMSQAILHSITESKPAEHTQVAVLYDNEEIGSQTLQGANSSFLRDILMRIAYSQNLNQEQQMMAFRKSFLISCDMAHAYHPNFGEKHDPAYTPLINHGPVIKMNANFRYATTADSCAVFENICHRSGVPVQKIINRSDLPCGSTVGPMTSAALSIPAVDIGNPMWAMHSIRETMGVLDHEYLIMALTDFYTNGIN